METTANKKAQHVLLRPFAVAWHFVVSMLGFTSHMVGFVVGAVFTVVGLFLTITVYAAPLGVALLLAGIFLVIRSVTWLRTEEDEA